MSLAKYYYNTTYLLTQEAHHKPVIFKILRNHISTVIVYAKWSQLVDHQVADFPWLATFNFYCV